MKTLVLTFFFFWSVTLGGISFAQPNSIPDTPEKMRQRILELERENARLKSDLVELFKKLATPTVTAPSESDVKALLEKKITTQSKGAIRLVSFKKTNGQAAGQSYAFEYEAEISFNADCYWGNGPLLWDGNYDATIGKPRSSLEEMSPAFFGKTRAKRGEVSKVTTKLYFEHTEKGWREKSTQLYIAGGTGAAASLGTAVAAPGTSTPGQKIRSSPAWPIVERAVQARGGIDNLRKAGCVKVALKGQMTDPAMGQMDMEAIIYSQAPDQMRQEVKIRLTRASVSQTFGISGTRVWQTVNGLKITVTPMIADNLKREAFCQRVEDLLALWDDTYEVALGEPARVDGKELPALHVSSPEGLKVLVMFDPESGCLVRRKYETLNSKGQTVTRELVYSDFKERDGCKVPFHTVGYEQGSVISEGDVLEWKVLQRLPDSHFAEPAGR